MAHKALRVVEYVAHAKVNLALGIAGRRSDGYHELVTLMTSVEFGDTVRVQESTQGPNVYCPSLPELPAEKNLVYRAWRSICRVVQCPDLSILVDKKIPPGQGLGGGSSDAAATLLAINEHFARKPLGFEQLAQFAAALGADVPFFLGPNSANRPWTAALCRGVGEKVCPIVNIGSVWLVLVLVKKPVSTPWAYSEWDKIYGYPDSPERRRDAERKVQRVVDALMSRDPEHLARVAFNDFESVIERSCCEISIVKQALLEAGALCAVMSGSGSAVYGICRDYEHAEYVAHRFAFANYCDSVLTWLVTSTGV